MKTLIIIPACNEAVSLLHFLPRLKGEVKKITDTEISIAVIDDGSNDDTSKVVQNSGCRLVRNDVNRGLGSSLRRGYTIAVEENYNFLISMDSDGQHDPIFLKHIIKELLSGVDLVTASRYHPDSMRYNPPLDRDLLNISVTAMMQSVTGWRHLTDPLTGFWGMTQRIADFLSKNLKFERYGTCLEGLIKLWYLLDNPKPNLKEVPHPAIYSNTNGGFLNRIYSPGNMEDRLDRFGTHARHILDALLDIQAAGYGLEIESAVRAWRQFNI